MHYLLTVFLTALLFTAGCATTAIHQHTDNIDAQVVLRAQQQLKTTFNNSFDISKFQASVLPGMYEIVINGQVIYYHHEANLLFLGQIFKQGLNLTSESLKQLAQSVDSSKGILVGTAGADAKLVAILDPDCPHSQNYYRLMQQLSTTIDIEQKILFDISVHPQAKPKLAHILCSDNPAIAYHNIMGGTIDAKDYQTCADYHQLYQAQLDEINKLSIAGTPTVILPNYSTISGFNQQQLLSYLKQYRPNITTAPADIDTSVAVSFGDQKGISITSVVDPDCPHCHKLHEYLQEKSVTVPIRQHILLDGRDHKKIAHIFCAPDQAAAYHQIMNGTIPPDKYHSCSKASQIHAQHLKEIKKLNVQGTPTVLINDQIIHGFDIERIETLLTHKPQGENQP